MAQDLIDTFVIADFTDRQQFFEFGIVHRILVVAMAAGYQVSPVGHGKRHVVFEALRIELDTFHIHFGHNHLTTVGFKGSTSNFLCHLAD